MTYKVPNQNPYDQKTKDQEPGTPTLDAVISQAVRAALLRARVCMPASIVKIHGNQKVDVQLLLKSRYASDNAVVSIPPIKNVTVNMPIGNGWRIKFPLKVGDKGWCIFCDRSLDVWCAGNGGIVDPQDTRAHDISDPVFFPGAVPFSGQSSDPPDQMLLVNGDSQIVIKPDGTFEIKNQAQELLNNLVNLVDTLSTASTVVGGPFIASVVNALNEIKANLTTLKG